MNIIKSLNFKFLNFSNFAKILLKNKILLYRFNPFTNRHNEIKISI